MKLYSADAAGELAQNVDLTIEQGSGGSFGSCSGFTPDATGNPIFTGTLATFAAHRDFATSVGTLTPTSAPTGKSYRFTYSPPGCRWDGAWHMVTASVGLAGMRLYLDGSPVAANSFVTTPAPVTPATGGWAGEI
ncbi:MAG TPA: hypothetical protein VFX70_10580 [Mycobacteriales bacterium]|nr:hypothetical protein [Mycobacteriales bacterium]